MKPLAELVEIDFGSDAYQAEPMRVLADLARDHKLARSARGFEILDYDLCRDAIVSRSLGTGHPKLMKVLGLPEGPALAYKQRSISFHNRGETRRKLRIPLTRLLGPEGSERFRTDIRGIVAATVQEIPTDRPIDLIQGLCDQIPSRVYCHWVGATLDDAPFVSETSHTVQQVHTRNPETTAEVVAGFEALLDYVDAHIEKARRTPSDTLLGNLVAASDAGELTEDELRNWVVKLAEANTDNSSHQIAIAVIELASRKDVWHALGRDPTLVPKALDEVMRYHPRSLSTSRETLQDIELDGYIVPEGEAVFANIAAAHWNPNYFPDPHVFRLDRPDRPAHLNFGGGIFSCIGRFVVTIELQEVIAYLARHFPDLTILDHQFAHSPMFTSVAQLRVRLQPQ